MASVAEKKRRRKRAVSLGRTIPSIEAPPQPAPSATIIRPAKYVRRQTGIEQLAGRAKLDQRQRHSLERYGRLYRIALIEDGAALRSCLGDLEGARIPGGGGLPTMESYAAVLQHAREDLSRARATLDFQVGLIMTCDAVCGRSMTPQEITEVRSEQLELEVSLRLAGDRLAKHFEEVGWRLS